MAADATTSELLGAADRVAEDAAEVLGPLVDRSSPFGDHDGYEACVRVVVDRLPPGATVERPATSTAGLGPDLLARVAGTGTRRLLLLGHLDTVVAHHEHRPLVRDGDRWDGSGTYDMKGGDALALGVLRALADRPAAFAEVALLLVADEEWRETPFLHGPAFEGWDACLCFEGGERTSEGDEAVVVRRKAAATVRVAAHGVAAHAGSRPDAGRSALLALAHVATTLHAHHDPGGPERLSVVPVQLDSGTALNVVPAEGRLVCDMRADDLSSVDRVIASLPAEHDGVALEVTLGRTWPGMDHREQSAGLLAEAGRLLGRPIVGVGRGGASDASHMALAIDVVVDGLGPLGGGAHAVDEHVDGGTLRDRAEVALAVAAAALAG